MYIVYNVILLYTIIQDDNRARTRRGEDKNPGWSLTADNNGDDAV